MNMISPTNLCLPREGGVWQGIEMEKETILNFATNGRIPACAGMTIED
jgi:hypothetical protein